MDKFAVLFDLDGTLLNTDELIYNSFRYVFNAMKPEYNLTMEELHSFLGPSLMSSLEKYFEGEDLDLAYQHYQIFNRGQHKKYVTMYDGVMDTLNILKDKGIPMGVVTSKLTEVAYIGLDQFEITNYFKAIIGPSEVKNLKPDPEGIHKAMKILDVDKAIYIGDNKSDIKAGINAGVITMGVSWTPKGTKEIEKLNPDKILDNMKEVLNYIEEEM